MLITSPVLAKEMIKRVISPGAIVGDVDALLAAGAGGDECAVDVEDGFVEEVGRLLLARP